MGKSVGNSKEGENAKEDKAHLTSGEGRAINWNGDAYEKQGMEANPQRDWGGCCRRQPPPHFHALRAVTRRARRATICGHFCLHRF
jgi:hypothetical protein